MPSQLTLELLNGISNFRGIHGAVCSVSLLIWCAKLRMWFMINYKPRGLKWLRETKPNQTTPTFAVWCRAVSALWTIKIRNEFKNFSIELDKFSQLKFLLIIISKLIVL